MKYYYTFIENIYGLEKGKISFRFDMIFKMARIIRENTLFLYKKNISWSDACKSAWYSAKEEKRILSKLMNQKSSYMKVSGGDFSTDYDSFGRKFKLVNQKLLYNNKLKHYVLKNIIKQ